VICRATVRVHDLVAGERVEVDAKNPEVKRLLAAGYLVAEKQARKRDKAS